MAWFSPSSCPVLESDGHCDRKDGQRDEEFVDKLLPLCFSLGRVRSSGAVGEFDESYKEMPISVLPTLPEIASRI